MDNKTKAWDEKEEIEAAKEAAKKVKGEFSKFNIWLTLLTAAGISATALLSWQILDYVKSEKS